MKFSFIGQEPELLITLKAWTKIRAYIDNYSEEISWLGAVKRLDKLRFLVSDVFLVNQACNSTTTEMDPSAILELGFKLHKAGELDPKKQDTEGTYLWGHSHHTMGTSPSGQDDKQMRDFAESNPPFFIRMISNKRGEHNIMLYLFDIGIVFSELNFVLMVDNHDDLISEIKAEIAAKVRKFSYTSTYPSGTGYPTYPHSGGYPQAGSHRTTPMRGGTHKYNAQERRWEHDPDEETALAEFFRSAAATGTPGAAGTSQAGTNQVGGQETPAAGTTTPAASGTEAANGEVAGSEGAKTGGQQGNDGISDPGTADFFEGALLRKCAEGIHNISVGRIRGLVRKLTSGVLSEAGAPSK